MAWWLQLVFLNFLVDLMILSPSSILVGVCHNQ